MERADHNGDTTHLAGHPLFGSDDAGHSVVPLHTAVASAMRLYGSLRLPRTDNPYHELLPAVLAQRVTAKEALSQWRTLCREWGEPVEVHGMRMHTPPRPEVLLSIQQHEWHLMGVDGRRAATIRQVARHAHRLLAGWNPQLRPEERTESLRLIAGVGEWTAAVAGHTSFGDPDALEFGDFHVKNTVSWALRGVPRGSDEEMRETMRPYAGHRRRVLTWLMLDGWRAPARGPRRRIVDIARI